MSQLSTVHILSKRETDISKRNDLGQTPVFAASMNEREDTFYLFLVSTFPHLIMKVDHHCLLHAWRGIKTFLNSFLNMELMFRCLSAEGYGNIVTTLIKHKADINQCDEEGMTPLFIACEKGRQGIAVILVNSKADLNVTDNKNRTLLYAVCRRGFADIVKL
ncbi:unnamed protein product [Mytilus coruscus]|uniref:Uncharacterized protein n=1 Tax=Mytilus coruscus TaxID=42192 RepID=A0A6J8ERA3_MYTCO|nr:unnamed protein product [Mytilus coruscus]